MAAVAQSLLLHNLSSLPSSSSHLSTTNFRTRTRFAFPSSLRSPAILALPLPKFATKSEETHDREEQRPRRIIVDFLVEQEQKVSGVESLVRRFLLLQGLGWGAFFAVGFLSGQPETGNGVQQEQPNIRDAEGAQEEMPAIKTKYVDYMDLAGGGGSSPKPGDMVIIGLKGKIQSTGYVFVDTFSGNRPSLSFVFGAKPYPEGICEGLEYTIQTMKTGGLRRATIPPDFGYGEMGAVLGGDISIPPAATLEYVVELQKVSVPTS